MASGGLREEADDGCRGLYGEGGREFRSGAIFPSGGVRLFM